MAVLHLKLTTRGEEQDLRELLEPAEVTVRHLFPDNRNGSLARMYSVETPDEPSTKQVLKTLRASASVEYVEEAPARHSGI